MKDLIERQRVSDLFDAWEAAELDHHIPKILRDMLKVIPSAQAEYEPVTAEDFAREMSENTLYCFMAWHSEAFKLMKRQGFVICKKTM